ncbi:hypothetical protein CYMTET_46687 [Cymbomonas tetramitiformis]|uniref:Uncharacterized protein n=1 Tax=Cymbomonas tetramitiformis TaxID=36881 RepID=A0AAE0BVN8_9CHLO|nr:hypothetical protein CYMTET_46687 [Cymbomonas tetramitiformis]
MHLVLSTRTLHPILYLAFLVLSFGCPGDKDADELRVGQTTFPEDGLSTWAISSRKLFSETQSCSCTGNNTGKVTEADQRYGTYCAPWDSIELYCTQGGDHFGETWCEESWCYVSAECGTAATAGASGASGHRSGVNASLYYSSAVCDTSEAASEECGGEEVLDNSTTCDAQSKLYAQPSTEGVHDSAKACCNFCKDNYPEAEYTDYWPNVEPFGYCNCYAYCNTTRCVSQECFGSYGGDVMTLKLPSPLAPLAPEPPSPPSQPSFPPPLPPAPPLFLLGTVVNITDPNPIYAGEHLRAALAESVVETVWLYVDVVLSGDLLPPINRSLGIFGLCASDLATCDISPGEGFQGRIFTVAQAGHLHLEALSLRDGVESEALGGCMLLESKGEATLRGSIVQNCRAMAGGGIACSAGALLRLHNTTITGCVADSNGGGLITDTDAEVYISDGSSVSANSCRSEGGGLYGTAGKLHVSGGSSFVGNSAPAGAGLSVHNSELSLQTGTIVSDNAAFAYGGGLLVIGGTVNMSDAEFTRNFAAERGGGFHVHADTTLSMGPNVTVSDNSCVGSTSGGGAGVSIYYASGEIFDSVIVGNSATGSEGAYGAGIRIYAAENSVVAVRRTYIGNNVAEGYGGGIYLGDEAALSLIDSQVMYNTASEAVGGGLYAGLGSTLNMTRSEVIMNSALAGAGVYTQATLGYIHGSSVSNNTAEGSGGGLLALGDVLVLASRIEHNKAEHGGGISITQGFQLQVEQSHLVNNSALHGGAVHGEDDCELVISGSELSRNSASKDGGAVHAGAYSQVDLRDTLLLENLGYLGGGVYTNTYTTLHITRSAIEQCGGRNGGGIYLSSRVATTLTDSNISSSYALTEGGGIYSESLLSYEMSTLTLSGSRVTDCYAGIRGGGLYAFRTVVTLGQGSPDSWLSNSAYYDGGALYVQNTELYGINVTISMNYAGTSGGGSGGGLLSEASLVELHGATFDSNAAKSTGGSIAAIEGGELTLEAGSFDSNVVEEGRGGGISVHETQATVIRCTMVNCQSAGPGGALSVEHSSVTLTSLRVLRSKSQDQGGAISAVQGVLNMTDIFLEGNVAAIVGGGLHLHESIATVREATFSKGSAARGAAAYLGTSSSLALQDAWLWKNGNNLTEGGGMYLACGASASVRNVLFKENAAHFGAGVMSSCASASFALSLEDSALSFNGVQGSGAGLYFEHLDEHENLTLSNLTFTNNSGGDTGGNNIFWLYRSEDHAALDRVAVDFCEACTADSPLYGTQATTFLVRQGGVAMEQAIVSSSGSEIAPPLEYVALDLYDQVVQALGSPAISVNSASTTDLSAEISGQTLALYDEGAEFSELTLRGTPGHTVTLTFEPDGIPAWDSASVSVTLQNCQVGEVYDAASKSCYECPVDQIVFSNSSSECVKCDTYNYPGINCTGGARFEILAGYWLSPNAQYCGEQDDPEICLLSRVGKCDAAPACTTDAALRKADGISEVPDLVLCNSEQFSGASPYCGGIQPVVCGSDYVQDLLAEDCQKCPALWANLLLVAFGVFVVIGFVCTMYLLYDKLQEADAINKLLRAAKSHRRALKMAQNTLSLLLGYIQVMSQMSNVFRSDILPTTFGYFRALKFVNIEISSTFSVKCLFRMTTSYDDTVEDAESESSFWYSFIEACITPGVLIVMFTIFYLLISILHTSKQRAKREALREEGEFSNTETLRSKVEEMVWRFRTRSLVFAVVLFLLMLVHPGTSTTIFQLFNCVEYQYDAEDMSTQWFLRMDISVECYTDMWWTAFIFALWQIFSFVIGFPLFLLCFMYHIESYNKVLVERKELNRYSSEVRGLGWIPVEEAEFIQLQMEVWQSLLRTRRGGSINQRSSWDNFIRRSVNAEDAGESIDLYMSSSTFELINTSAPRVDLFRTPSLRQRSSALWGKVNNNVVPNGTELRNVLMQLQDGHQLPAAMYEKFHSGSVIPVTLLDDERLDTVLEQFKGPFIRSFYFWQCWEITRRLLMTSIVVLVQVVSNENTAIFFGLVVSLISICLHQQYSPYKLDEIDKLQLMILINQALFQLVLLFTIANDDSGPKITTDIMIITSQVVVFAYAAFLIWPIVSPAIRVLSRGTAEHVTSTMRRSSVFFSMYAPRPSTKSDDDGTTLDEEGVGQGHKLPEPDSVRVKSQSSGVQKYTYTNPLSQKGENDDELNDIMLMRDNSAVGNAGMQPAG